MNESRLFEVTTGYEDDPPVFVLAKNIRDALAKYKNDLVNIVNAENAAEAAATQSTAPSPLGVGDIEDPASVCMIGDVEQVIL